MAAAALLAGAGLATAFAAEIEGVKLPRVWLGDQPADAALKKAMLGG